MGVMMVWHPDIEAFIEAKANSTEYTQFNLSVGITDEFIHARPFSALKSQNAKRVLAQHLFAHPFVEHQKALAWHVVVPVRVVRGEH